MTGYGAATGKVKKGRLFVEIKTINHRYCEISLRIPSRMAMLEGKIREFLKNKIERGKVDIFMKELDPIWGGTKLALDTALAKQYQQAIATLQRALHLPVRANPLELIGASNFIQTKELEGDYAKTWGIIRPLFAKALNQAETMRRREGAHLLQDQKMRLKKLGEFLKKIEKLSNKNWQKKQGDLATVVSQLPPGSESPSLDNKSDITEELTRLVSHVQQYGALLGDNEPVGRKLDFFIQEMHREVNTIGAKACDAFISGLIVESKSELEKLREQVQNVE